MNLHVKGGQRERESYREGNNKKEEEMMAQNLAQQHHHHSSHFCLPRVRGLISFSWVKSVEALG